MKIIIDKFKSLYGAEPSLFRAPGRINLIGEHTDYNEGFVMPAAINRYVYLAIKPNQTTTCNLYSSNFEQHFSFEIERIKKTDLSWPNYIMGVVETLKYKGLTVLGFDAVFWGDIPYGAGLSSSAALEMVFTFAFNHIFSFNLALMEQVKIAQKAENDFVGVKCGIMDQFISGFGKKDKALKLDCRSLEFEYFNTNLGEYSIVLIDSMVKHSLASGEYNKRREDCETAVDIIYQNKKNLGLELPKSLRDVDLIDLEDYRTKLPEKTYKRAKYVIEENLRVEKASRFLAESNFQAFGKELFKTHRGLSKDYEVSCEELDFLIQLAEQEQNLAGARMMGGGFGGCTLNVIKKTAVSSFKASVLEAYNNTFGKKPNIYELEIVDGVSKVV